MTQAHRHPGFAIVPSVLSQLEADGLAACLEPQRRTRAGARHLMSLHAVSMVAVDPRMIAIATERLGAPAIPFRTTLFDKAPGSNWLVRWHQDRALPLMERLEASGWGPWSLKGGVHYAQAPVEALEKVVALRLSLDDSAEHNGPLRVLPGTESRGVLTDAEIAALAQEIAPVDCCVDAGTLDIGGGLRLAVV